MKQIKWFDRTFEFSFEQNIFPSIVERLEGTSVRICHKLNNIPKEHLTGRIDNTWSIQENVGHLLDLEPLWHGRLEDILNNKEYLRSADLENRKTHLAAHNEEDIDVLLEKFLQQRKITLDSLVNITEDQVYKHALHPRLKTPMRTMDLFLFVAEHDDHHLARISELNVLLSK